MTAPDFKLYLITDRKQASTDLLTAVEQALEAGVRAVQLREKDLSIRELTTLALQMRALTNRYGARLFINDRIDVAMAVGADGVHLSRTSLPPYTVRKLTNDSLMLGLSTHSIDEAVEAVHSGVHFITLGPVYKTPAKMKYGKPVGTALLRKVKAEVDIPVFAIGGIKRHKIREVMDCNADGVAVISGILSSDSIYKETQQYMELLR